MLDAPLLPLTTPDNEFVFSRPFVALANEPFETLAYLVTEGLLTLGSRPNLDAVKAFVLCN